MIGSGIFLLSRIAISLAGPAAVFSNIAVGIVCIITAASAAESPTGMPTSGGDYFFVSRSLGPAFGAISGIGVWLSLTFAIEFNLRKADRSQDNINVILPIIYLGNVHFVKRIIYGKGVETERAGKDGLDNIYRFNGYINPLKARKLLKDTGQAIILRAWVHLTMLVTREDSDHEATPEKYQLDCLLSSIEAIPSRKAYKAACVRLAKCNFARILLT